jgi:hypothetical protein
MKTLITVIALALTATAAQADGFKCSAVDGSLDVKVYNNVQPELGTRTAAKMVLSNPLVAYGNKTIATFEDSTGLLSSEGAAYEAKVDLRYAGSARKGELIAGTKLGQIDSLRLEVPFSYNMPVEHGQRLRSALIIAKRNGDSIDVDMDCVRYLKN